MVNSAKGVTFGGFTCRVASFRVAGGALRDIQTCFVTCRKSFCAAGAILLRRFQKMRCSFRGRRSTLDVSIVILRGRRNTLDVSCRVFCESHCQGCVKRQQGANSVAGAALKIDGSLAQDIDFEVANFEVHKKTLRKTLILKLQSVKIGGSLARNARFDAPTCLVSSLWFSCGLAVSMGEAAKPFLFECGKASCNVVLRGRRGTSWHFHVSAKSVESHLVWQAQSFGVVFRKELAFSWQAQHFGDLHRHFAWQAHQKCRIACSTLHTLHSTLPHFTLHTSHSTLYTPHFTLYTPHFTLYTPHFTLYISLYSTLHTRHSTLQTSHTTLHTLHFTLHTPDFTLYTLHSTLHTPHISTLCTLHFTLHTSPHISTLYNLQFHLHTPHSTSHTPHFTLHTLHFKLHTPHSTLHTLHCTLHSLHFTLHTLHHTIQTPQFTLHTKPFTPHTLYSTLHTSHSTVYTPHSPLYTPHSTLYPAHFTLHTPHFTL